ncbi:MAG: hypothetical protein AAGF07_05405, partial [Patescibacteria group bacterium]
MSSTVHYTPCEQLPSFEEVEEKYEQHYDVIEKIKLETSVFYTDSEGNQQQEYLAPRRMPDCQDKGDVFMYVYSSRDRDIILDILGTSDFFGIPMTIENV